ncbi:hypothetical protein Lal_00001445 [Lupinus albus]|nr:hypothetical protein Lal_00001445 [Lupinus albus]
MGSKSLTSSLLPFDGSNKVGCPYSVVEAIRVESGASSKLNFVFEAPLCVCSRGISCGYRGLSVATIIAKWEDICIKLRGSSY